MTTAAADSVRGAVTLLGGALNLGAVMNVGELDLRVHSTLNMNNHTLTAEALFLGYFICQPVTILNRGVLTTRDLSLGNMTFNLNAIDTVANYSLRNATSRLNSSVSYLQAENGSHGHVTGAVKLLLNS